MAICMTGVPAIICVNTSGIWWPISKRFQINGPWPYKLSELYDEPAVTAAVEKIAAAQHAKIAA